MRDEATFKQRRQREALSPVVLAATADAPSKREPAMAQSTLWHVRAIREQTLASGSVRA
eukprot:CAMPEP_0171241610 /NCGR_PEP_ID=MMETSP0790-20130122/45186_1 /TAXON_ID=2925 /ORGANISM="Alexandrium catenella, Strain OF101" /LENGTH=58 /DNA_ID=CAMNT_0011708229 /DNA_START=62 /DNA_END=234 /DNA_ORIENTATION=-